MLFEVCLIEIQEESITLLVGRGGLIGAKIVNKHFVNKLAPQDSPSKISQFITQNKLLGPLLHNLLTCRECGSRASTSTASSLETCGCPRVWVARRWAMSNRAQSVLVGRVGWPGGSGPSGRHLALFCEKKKLSIPPKSPPCRCSPANGLSTTTFSCPPPLSVVWTGKDVVGSQGNLYEALPHCCAFLESDSFLGGSVHLN